MIVDFTTWHATAIYQFLYEKQNLKYNCMLILEAVDYIIFL